MICFCHNAVVAAEGYSLQGDTIVAAVGFTSYSGFQFCAYANMAAGFPAGKHSVPTAYLHASGY